MSSNMNFSIRPMVIDDIPFFNAVRNQSREFLHDPREYTIEQSREWFITTNPKFYILELDGVPIGYFRTSNSNSYSIYIGLDIAEQYRGRGYAIPAYKMFMDYLVSTGIQQFMLKVLSTNQRAIHIYNKLGFREVSRVFNSERGCNDILMQCHVSDSWYIINNLTYTERDAFRHATVLITGCNGFIGVWLMHTFKYLNATCNLNLRVFALDIHESVHESIRDDIPSFITYHQANISECNLGDITHGWKLDYIFNCAGIAVPMQYMRMPIQTLDVSYIGTKNVLEFAMQESVRSVICFSSSEVYGSPEPDAIPTAEDHVGRIHTHSNRSCYDVGKLVLETLCYTYHQQYNVPVKVIRPFNLYGPLMDDTRVVPNFIRRVISDEPVMIYGDGNQTRTYCYIADAIVMILKLCVVGDNGGIYNVGNSNPEINLYQLVDALEEGLGITIGRNRIPYPDDYPDNEPLRRCPDITKVINATKFTPTIPLQVGLKKTYNYFKNK